MNIHFGKNTFVPPLETIGGTLNYWCKNEQQSPYRNAEGLNLALNHEMRLRQLEQAVYGLPFTRDAYDETGLQYDKSKEYNNPTPVFFKSPLRIFG